MITYCNQSIFDFRFNSIIAHGVNCQGVMGSGVAKQIKETYPLAYNQYKQLCDTGNVDNSFVFSRFCDPTRSHPLLGTLQLVDHGGVMIANLFTQEYYGKDGRRYTDQTSIYKALLHLAYTIKMTPAIHQAITIPKIGCGLGGLHWETDVEPILREVYKSFPLNYIVCSI